MNGNEIRDNVIKELEFSEEEKQLFIKMINYVKLYQLDKSFDLKKKIESIIKELPKKDGEGQHEI